MREVKRCQSKPTKRPQKMPQPNSISVSVWIESQRMGKRCIHPGTHPSPGVSHFADNPPGSAHRHPIKENKSKERIRHMLPKSVSPITVAYTHLRAHVCPISLTTLPPPPTDILLRKTRAKRENAGRRSGRAVTWLYLTFLKARTFHVMSEKVVCCGHEALKALNGLNHLSVWHGLEG